MGNELEALRLDLAEDVTALALSTVCTPGLWRLLTEGEDRAGAIRLIRINPTLNARLREVGPMIMDRARVATDEQIAGMVIKLMAQFGVKDLSPEQHRSIMTAYLDALQGLPVESLNEAVIGWNQGKLYPDQPGRHAFMPQPAELVALAKEGRNKLAMAAFRAKLALEAVIEQEGKIIAPEAAAEMRAALKGLASEIKGGAVPGGPASMGKTPQQVASELRTLAETPTFDDEEAI